MTDTLELRERRDKAVQQSVETVASRRRLLELLESKALTKHDLVEETDQSRSTIDRAIRELEEVGFVERTRSSYETTVSGRLARERLEQFLAESTAIVDTSAVLSELPDEPALPVSLVETATPEQFESPFQAFESLAPRLHSAERCQVMLATLEDTRYLRLWHQLVVEGELDCEIVLPAAELRALAFEYPTRCAELIDAGALSVVDDLPSMTILTLTQSNARDDDSDGAIRAPGDTTGNGSAYQTSVAVFHEVGDGRRALLHSTDEDAVAWARALHDRHRNPERGGTSVLQDVGAGSPLLDDDPRLPQALRSEGLVRVDDAYFDRRDTMSPTTAWRAGLDLPEVQAGFAIERRSPEVDRPLSETLFDQLRGGDSLALLGPPGSGKSTVAKRVACDWYEHTSGTVLYRESGRGDRLSSLTTLETVIQRAEGPTLIVVEDGVRSEANAIFEFIRRFEGDENVAVLLDARESEWADPDRSPLDAQTEAIRRDVVDVTHLPRLTEAECERLIDRAGTLTDAELAVSPADLLEDIRQTARESVGEKAQAGTVFLLFHRLARTIDPLADTADASSPVTVLDEHVDRVRAELAKAGETALEVGIVANVCNAAGLDLDPASLYTPMLAEDADVDAVRAGLEVLEDECLFSRPDADTYRGIHESWSAAFLERLLAEMPEADERFGQAMTRLLSLADDDDQRVALVDTVGETPELSSIAIDPAGWVQETVEALFEMGRFKPKLAGLFVDDGTPTIDLPEGSPSGLEEQCVSWVGWISRVAGLYDSGEAAFQQLPADGGRGELERVQGLAVIAQERGQYDQMETYATNCLEIGEEIDDQRARAQGERLLGSATFRRGEYQAAFEHYRQAHELGTQMDDQILLVKILLEYGAVLFFRGELEQAEHHLQNGLDIADGLGCRAVKAGCIHHLGFVAQARNDLDVARERYRRSLEMNEATGHRRHQAEAHRKLGEIATQRNELDRAEEYFERSLDIERELGARHEQAKSLGYLGSVALAKNDLDRAEELLQESIEIYDELSLWHHQAEALVELGRVALGRGTLDTAGTQFEEARSVGADSNNPESGVAATSYLGLVALLDGHLETAREHCNEAIDAAAETELQQWHATAEGLLGAVDIAAGSPADGRPACADALATLSEGVPATTPRGVEVCWAHAVAESRQGTDERVTELQARAEDWLDEAGGSPGVAYWRLDALADDS